MSAVLDFPVHLSNLITLKAERFTVTPCGLNRKGKRKVFSNPKYCGERGQTLYGILRFKNRNPRDASFGLRYVVGLRERASSYL